MKTNRVYLLISLVFLLVLVSLILNTFNLSSIPGGLHGDEAQHGLQAISILKGNNHIFDFGWYGLPIPSFYAQTAGVWAFKNTIFALRIPSAIIGSLTLIPFYFLVVLLFDRKTAFFSLIFLVTSHWWIAFSRLGENYIQVPFIAVVGFWLILLSFRSGKLWIAFLAGVVIAINFYLYFAARLTPVLEIFLIAYCVWAIQPRKAHFRIIIFILIGFLITVLPFLNSSIGHGGLAFSRQNDVFIYGSVGSKWRQEIYGDSDVWSVLRGQLQRTFYLSSRWHDTSGQYGYRGWIIDPASGILFVIGLIGIVFIGRSGFKWFPFLWLVITVGSGWILTEKPPFSPRIIGAIPALAIILGYGVTTLTYCIRKLTIILRIVIVSAVMLPAIIYNINAYFVKGVQEEWGDPNKYIATDVAGKMNTLSGYTTIFITAPYLYADYGPIQYLTANKRVVSIDGSSGYKPVITPHTLYVIHPMYDFYLENIIEVNPGGRLSRKMSHSGSEQILYYQVD